MGDHGVHVACNYLVCPCHPFSIHLKAKEQDILHQVHMILLYENSLPAADIPLKWYALEILMEEMVQVLGQGVLNKQECFNAATKKLHFNANANEFEAALEYLNKLSVLFYYPCVLPNIIFADPRQS